MCTATAFSCSSVEYRQPIRQEGWQVKKKKLTKDRKSSTKLRASGVFSGCWTLSLICRLQRFTQALPKRSKCFRSDGCEAGLHPNTSWRQRLLRYWLPFSSCLQERGSNARRRNNNKVHGALLRTPKTFIVWAWTNQHSAQTRSIWTHVVVDWFH